MRDDEQRRVVQELLDGLSDEEVRAICLEALRRWWRDPSSAHGRDRALATPTFQMHGHLGRQALPLLAQRKNVKLSADDVDGPLKEADEPG